MSDSGSAREKLTAHELEVPSQVFAGLSEREWTALCTLHIEHLGVSQAAAVAGLSIGRVRALDERITRLLRDAINRCDAPTRRGRG